MFFLYDVIVHLARFFLLLTAPFNPKLMLFRKGRQSVFPYLQEHLDKQDQVIWVHAASLGEYEQGLPVIKSLKDAYPGYKILVTFFSPSGYEVKKNSAEVDLVTYLPLDTRINSRKFLDLVHPSLAIFIKYEIWPNYLRALEKRNIPTLLVSAIFNTKQPYFKRYGGFMRKALRRFRHIFVQDDHSSGLLNSLNIPNNTVSGDTRFDRVVEIRGKEKPLPLISRFVKDDPCLVAGSTWPEDEAVLLPYINADRRKVKYILVPHDIKPAHIKSLLASITQPVRLYSELTEATDFDFKVLVVDKVGLLSSLYRFAQVAYVGGGFATGLHNTLEPAVYGIPVLIGPQYHGFREAEDLVTREGLLSVADKEEFQLKCDRLLMEESLRLSTGQINTIYIEENQGATEKIVGYVRELLPARGS